jgi:RNA polymerase sigma factor (sigma-70 family)
MACATAYTMLDDAGLAEDVTQEAFIEAYQNLPKLREIDAFPGWFRRIIFKQGDRLLHGKHLPTVSLEASEVYEKAIDTLDPATMLESGERAMLVQRAIEALPEHERIVTLLFYRSGYPLKEIAAFLEIPLTTVKKRLHDARKRLHTILMDTVRETLREQQPVYADYFSQKVRILIAARLGDIASVQAMLERDPTLVHASMKRGEYLLKSRQALNVGDTPIYEAAAHNHSELVRLLLDYGADINICTSADEMPLHGAIAAHHLSMVTLLLDCGADINASLAHGQTPLRLAIIKGYADIVELLLARGARANTRGKTGLTPLHWAALKGQPAIVSLLLTHGAGVFVRDDAGRTPLDWARQRAGRDECNSEFQEVMRLLRTCESVTSP